MNFRTTIEIEGPDFTDVIEWIYREFKPTEEDEPFEGFIDEKGRLWRVWEAGEMNGHYNTVIQTPILDNSDKKFLRRILRNLAVPGFLENAQVKTRLALKP